MLEIKFTEAAENDLIEARDWYVVQSETLGLRFEAEVRHQLGRIGENPLQFPVIRRDARRVLLRNFPYAIMFRVADDVAYIMAIFHFSRNPRIWRKRL